MDLQWGVLTPENILAHSVCRVFEPGMKKIMSVEESIGTLADRRMGKVHMNDTCMTCNSKYCQGNHYGHIDLPVACFIKHLVPKLHFYIRQLCCKCWGVKQAVCPANQSKCETARKIKYLVTGIMVIDGSEYTAQMLHDIFTEAHMPEAACLIATRLQVTPIIQRQYRLNNLGNYVHDGKTKLYDEILKAIDTYKSHTKAAPQRQAAIYLYFCVNDLYNADPAAHQASGFLTDLKSKHGKVRKDFLGRTVDECSRSVIIGDPHIPVDTIGIPYVISRNLFIRERVTQYNIATLRWMIRRGMVAMVYLNDVGYELYDNPFTETLAKKLCVGDMVKRCLLDNDYVAFNRQPTLHSAGFMGFKVKIMPGLAFRMNVSDTSPFNADFDGDEMTIHVPRSVEAMADIQELMSVTNYIVGSSGSTQIGLIFQSLSAIYEMSKDGVSVRRADFMDYCFIADVFDTDLFDTPRDSYTTIELLRIVFKKYMPFTGVHNDLKIVNGEYFGGRIKKMHVGVGGCLIRNVWVREKQQAADFIHCLQKVTMAWIERTGFTVGIDEFMLDSQSVRDMVNACTDDMTNQQLDDKANLITMEVNKQIQKQENNSMLVMLNSGAKGDITKATHISTIIGMNSINGEHMQQFFGTRPLPICKPGNSMENRGFILGNYLKGLNPVEVVGTQMAGRVSMICKLIRTADTGSLSRKLIHRVLDYVVFNDLSVRNPLGNIVQLTYGDDGLDPVYKNGRLIEPGTPVGLIAAQSMSERLTQAMLNTMHVSGTAKKHSSPRILQLLSVTKTEGIVTLQVKNADLLAVQLQNKEKWIKSYSVVDAIPDEPWYDDFKQCFGEVSGTKFVRVCIDRTAEGFVSKTATLELLYMFPRGTACVNNACYDEDVVMYVSLVTSVQDILNAFKSGKYTSVTAKNGFLHIQAPLSDVINEFPSALHSKTCTDSIQDAMMFGVEYARSVCLREFMKIETFKTFDIRHLKLIVDIMFYTGKPFGIGIKGISSATTSSLTKMCARDASHHMAKAAMANEYDSNTTIFSNIITGQHVPVGTNFPDTQIINHIHHTKRARVEEPEKGLDLGEYVQYDPSKVYRYNG